MLLSLSLNASLNLSTPLKDDINTVQYCTGLPQHPEINVRFNNFMIYIFFKLIPVIELKFEIL